MLAPLDQIDDQSLHTEVCIIGAGPAGITLTLEVAEKGVDVALLEGGTLVPPGPDGLDLYRGEISGRKYRLPVSRLRYFGGTSGHWGGWCRPLDEVDLRRSQILSSADGQPTSGFSTISGTKSSL